MSEPNRVPPPQLVDDLLLSEVKSRWLKMARIVGWTLRALEQRGYTDVNEEYLARRVREFVAAGRIEAVGNTFRMGFCEVRLPPAATQD